MMVLPLLLVACEFGLRCASYDRVLLYERQGDSVVHTVPPNQEYVEKDLAHAFNH